MRAWDEFLTELEKDLGKETIKKWLSPLKVVRFDACNLYLEAEDSFKAIWFEEHVRHKIKNRLLNNNKKQILVHITLADQKSHEEPKAKKKAVVGAPPPFQLIFDSLDEKCSFSDFITSQSNLLPYKLLCEACGLDSKTLQKITPVVSFNPIYLFGRKGTGKTHLMMAVAKALTERGSKAVYVRAETFTEHVVSAIRTGEMQAFRKMYRNAEALLIDDIEVFSRKNATQEELFHTFNTLHVEGKQIILSGSSSPQELKFIEPRLISRFEWGIVIPLQTLGKEEMRTLLIKRAEQMHFSLSEEVIDFLLGTFGGNTKSLIRSLEALILREHLSSGVKNNKMPLDQARARHVLSDLIQEEEKAYPHSWQNHPHRG